MSQCLAQESERVFTMSLSRVEFGWLARIRSLHLSDSVRPYGFLFFFEEAVRVVQFKQASLRFCGVWVRSGIRGDVFRPVTTGNSIWMKSLFSCPTPLNPRSQILFPSASRTAQ